MVMACTAIGDVALRERLPALWRRIEDAHYSYLETEDSPEKLQQKKKLEGYIIEYLSLVPHECKFGLSETVKVFQRTINELPEYSAYRAGIGWAAIARYAANLLAQPWRKEYKMIRLYCGFYKHEVEANLVGAELLLQALGYRPIGAGRLALQAPVCPDMVAAVSRDALLAHCECRIMSQIWEAVWGGGGRATWGDVARERAARAASPAAAAARLRGYAHESEIYSNVPAPTDHPRSRLVDTRQPAAMSPPCNHVYPDETFEEPVTPMVHPYMMSPNMMHPHMMYPLPHQHMNPEIPVPVPHNMSVMTPYGAIPYYYPVQAPYMIPTPVYAPIKHAATVPVNGYPPYTNTDITVRRGIPSVPTAQLIELDSPSVYENGKFERHRDDERSHRKTNRLQESSKRNSTSKSGFSDVSLPSLPRSDTQPTLSKAKEDGMGTYESWDYVFRNLYSKDKDGDSRSGFSQSLDRDSRTLDRLDREERRSKYQPTTLDLEDGLQALNLDRSYDEDAYRTAKVNESLMRLKQEQELKRARQMAKKKIGDDRKPKKSTEAIGNPNADGLVTPKIAPDKVKLLTKKDVKDRKEIIKQQNSLNGSTSNAAEVRKVKKPAKLVAADMEKPKSKPIENGVHKTALSSKAASVSNSHQPNYDLKAQLVVSLDEPDARRSPLRQHNGDRSERERTSSRTSEHERMQPEGDGEPKREKWQCGTCTYLNAGGLSVCEMCGKSRRGPSLQPLTAGGRECPACTLVNRRDARACDACGTALDRCPTYI